jgi:hypothetical protein
MSQLYQDVRAPARIEVADVAHLECSDSARPIGQRENALLRQIGAVGCDHDAGRRKPRIQLDIRAFESARDDYQTLQSLMTEHPSLELESGSACRGAVNLVDAR